MKHSRRGIDAPFILPNPNLAGKNFYFNASRWSDYNVLLLKTNLGKLL